MALMGSNWSKDIIFGENGQNWVIFGQNDVIGPNLGEVVNKVLLLKFGKIISVRFINITLVKNVMNGVNLVKIGHF